MNTIKLQAISAISHSTINKVSEVFNIANTTLKFWIRTFEKSGIEELKSKVKNPKKPKLNLAQKEQNKNWSWLVYKRKQNSCSSKIGF